MARCMRCLGAWHSGFVLWSRRRIASVWRQSWPIATGRRSMWRGSGSSYTRPLDWTWRRSPDASGSAGQRSGAGSFGLPSDGLLRDRVRKPGKPRTPDAVVQWVVALTCSEPSGEAAHWMGRAMAEATGLSLRTVQRIWAAHRGQPHRSRTFKRSHDPEFITKLADIVGLYLAPPRHAVVLSVDEKSQTQALDRTQPGLPLRPGKAGTMTHDYVRHGTTALFAALNVLDGIVLDRCMQRHRHQEFIRLLNTIEAAAPAGKLVHVILDNYGTHKHAKVGHGSSATSAGRFTTPRPRVRG